MNSKTISNPNLLKILDEQSDDTYHGCNQEWYATEWQRLSGCGPTVACNIFHYLNHTRPCFGLNQHCDTKTSSLFFMEDIWKYVTPTADGIPTTKMFYETVISYAQSKGLHIEYYVCDVPENPSIRPQFNGVRDFLEEALSRDSPIAFLNLCSGQEQNLVSWHWVTIISLDIDKEESRAFINILDGGLIKKIDLSLWFKTTTRGGGFVYFMPSPNVQQKDDPQCLLKIV